MKTLSPFSSHTGAAGLTASGVGKGAYPLRIHEFRKRAGLTQAALATAIGVSREHLCRIERGERFITEPLELRITRRLALTDHERTLAFGYPSRPSSTDRDDEQGPWKALPRRWI